MTVPGDRWSIIVPVKRLEVAKSRLALAVDERAAVALAMACDTVAAATGCATVGDVVVVTDDRRARVSLEAVGARVVGDAPDAGLNPALRHGAEFARTSRVAALSSDLPALTSDELHAALALAAQHPRSVVADASGRGTTLLAASAVADFAPAFGADSLGDHVRAGAVDISAGVGPRLRCDVDTIEALRVAIDLGVGAATARALRDVSLDLRPAH